MSWRPSSPEAAAHLQNRGEVGLPTPRVKEDSIVREPSGPRLMCIGGPPGPGRAEGCCALTALPLGVMATVPQSTGEGDSLPPHLDPFSVIGYET